MTTLLPLMEVKSKVSQPTQKQTFGFWGAISFLVAAWLLSKELIRKEKEGKVKSTTKKVIIGKKLSYSIKDETLKKNRLNF